LNGRRLLHVHGGREPAAASASVAASPAERLEQLISERRVRGRIAVLARRIDADYRGTPLGLVVVLKGACLVAADLMRRLTIPCAIDFVAASSYGKGTRSSGKVALDGLDRLDIAGRHMLVVEDILDTGRTAAAVLAALRQCGPASVALCTLLRKPAARALELELPVRYVGFDTPDDFVVGYGLDYAERYRNLRGVYRLILDRGDPVDNQGGDGER
jgi:hypoxanthine phosphoribosyltransferase